MAVHDLVNLERGRRSRTPEPVPPAHVMIRYVVGCPLVGRRERRHLHEVEPVTVDDKCAGPAPRVEREELAELLIPKEILRRRPAARYRILTRGEVQVGNDEDCSLLWRSLHPMRSPLTRRRNQ